MNVVLRVLLQAEPDTDPTEFALAMAAGVGGPIFVVNATGKELGGYRLRHDFVELVDGRGRPTRSVTEIIEAVAQPAGQIGCLVILDVARIYRASRCAVRQGESIKELSPGHWDAVNESLGRLGETLTRRGVPSIWTAPSTSTHGLDQDGRDVVVGSAPQAWRDLTRQANVWLSLERQGTTIDAEIRGDDFRELGQLGGVLRAANGRELGRRLAPFVSRVGRSASTTMDEAAAAELGARDRLQEQRERQALELFDRYQLLAPVRALRGRQHWDQMRCAWARDRHRLSPEQAGRIDQVLSSYERIATATWQTTRAYEQTLEHSAADPEQALGLRLAGPSPVHASSPASVPLGPEFERLTTTDVASWVDAVPREHLGGLVRTLAEELDVWSRPRLAAIAGTLPSRHLPSRPEAMPPLGPVWDAYTDEHLRNLLASLATMVVVERGASFELGDGAPSWRASPRNDIDRPTIQPLAVVPTNPTADYLDLVSDDDAPTTVSPAPIRDEFVDAERFAAYSNRDQVAVLSALLTLRDQWGELPAICQHASVEPGTRAIARWSSSARVQVYQFLRSQRAGPAPPLVAIG